MVFTGLSRKLTIALATGILIVMAAYAAIMIRSEVRIFRADLKKNGRIGRALKATIEDVWQTRGESRARELVEDADDEIAGLGLRIARLDAGAAGAGLSPERTARVAGGEVVRFIRRTADGDRRRHTFLRLEVPADGLYALELFESLREQLTFIRMNRVGVVVASLAVTVVCTLIVMFVATRMVVRPIQMLIAQARRIGSGNLSKRLDLPPTDEIGQLAGELDAMCDQLAASTEARVAALDQMRHAERLATVGKIASGVAHQLGTPLNVIGIRAKMIADAAADEVPRKNAQVIAEQVERMTGIVRRLLDFSRRRTVARGRTDLTRIVSRTLDLVGAVAERRGVFIKRDVPDRSITVEIDEEQFQQALANIMLNGVQATEAGGSLTVRVGVLSATGREHGPEQAFVTIEDQGAGITPEQREQLFEPFFTTKPPGEGTGLGLSVAQEIVRDHDGRIVVGDAPGGGASFTVLLSLADADVEKAS